MGQNLCLAIGKDQCQFVREPLPIMQDSCAVFFPFLPVISELHGTPVSNVAVFTFAEYPIEHPRRAEQSDVPAMQGREWPPSHITLFGKKDATRLAVGRGIEQQILDVIERKPDMGEDKRPGAWNFVTDLGILSQWLEIAARESFKPTYLGDQNRVRESRVSFAAGSEHNDLFELKARRCGQPENAQVLKLLT